MAMIKLSYEQQDELQTILSKLKQVFDVKKVRKPKKTAGRYQKAYIEIDIKHQEKV